MNLLKEVSDTLMIEITETSVKNFPSRFFRKLFNKTVQDLYICNCCFIYSKTHVYFLKDENPLNNRTLYDISKLSEEHIDMIIYDKLMKL